MSFQQDEFPDQFTSHESEEDLKHQTETMLEFCRTWGFSALSMPKDWVYDITLISDTTPISLAEIKYRYHRYGKHQTYTIDKWKVDMIRREARERGLSALLIVSWLGEIKFTDLRGDYRLDKQTRKKPTKGKSAPRRELTDVVYHIPIVDFH